MCMVSMDCALGSIGGGCIGTNEVVDHQRLSGSGYCFSAACPPFLFASAVDALTNLQSDGPELLSKMRSNVTALVTGIGAISNLEVISHKESPVVHIALELSDTADYDSELLILERIAEKCVKNGVGLTATTHDIKLLKDIKTTSKSLRATLRINVTATLNTSEIKKIVKEIKASVKDIVG